MEVNLTELEDALQKPEQHAPDRKEVLDATHAAENTDIAYIMAMQLNVMIEANRRIRNENHFNYTDVMRFYRIVRALLEPTTVVRPKLRSTG